MSKRTILGFFCYLLFILVPSLALEVQQPIDYLYWASIELHDVGRATLDRTEILQHIFYPTYPSAIGASGLAIDENHVYWTNMLGSNIGRANLDGSNMNPNFIVGCHNPWGLAIDDQYIYWTNIEPVRQIGRAKLDGSAVEQNFIQLTPELSPVPRGIAVNGNFIYWASAESCNIGRANLDRSDIQEAWITSAENPHCITFTKTHIYWTNYNTHGNNSNWIGRANLSDGTGPETWLTGFDRLVGIVTKGGYVYWGEMGQARIGRARLDKSEVIPDWIASPVAWACHNLAVTPEGRIGEYYLHGTALNLFMNNDPPTAPTPLYIDSPSINRTTYREIGTWGMIVSREMKLKTSTSVDVWLGLKNSDDQGTYFDLKFEILKNTTVVATGETINIRGVTRNPGRAIKATVAIANIPSTVIGTEDTLGIRISTKVAGAGGHANAVGLRLYYDGISRPSKIY